MPSSVDSFFLDQEKKKHHDYSCIQHVEITQKSTPRQLGVRGARAYKPCNSLHRDIEYYYYFLL